MGIRIYSSEHLDLTTKMTEAALAVLCDNGTSEWAIKRMRKSLRAAMLQWFEDNYRYKDAKNAWLCAKCKKESTLCERCLEKAVFVKTKD
jgi:cell fate regulator YaaT (PSP1 superfamily)